MDVQQAVDQFVRAWGRVDVGEAEAELRECCVPDIAYVDPLVETYDVTQLAMHVSTIGRTLRGATVHRVSAIDVNRDWARFEWAVTGGPAARANPRGLFVVRFDSLLVHGIAFFGALVPQWRTVRTVSKGSNGRVQA